jgi:hypothetical protein
MTTAPLRTVRRSGFSFRELRFFFGSFDFRSFDGIAILPSVRAIDGNYLNVMKSRRASIDLGHAQSPLHLGQVKSFATELYGQSNDENQVVA